MLGVVQLLRIFQRKNMPDTITVWPPPNHFVRRRRRRHPNAHIHGEAPIRGNVALRHIRMRVVFSQFDRRQYISDRIVINECVRHQTIAHPRDRCLSMECRVVCLTSTMHATNGGDTVAEHAMLHENAPAAYGPTIAGISPPARHGPCSAGRLLSSPAIQRPDGLRVHCATFWTGTSRTGFRT